MRRKQALSLLELIFVVSIVAVLLAISALGITSYNSRLELKTAKQIFIQSLNRARSDARHNSLDYKISFNQNSITIKNNKITKTYRLGNISLNKLKGSKYLTYTAPYGKTTATNFEFELVSKNGLKTKVYVYGVTGKVADLD